jgi:transcriptional regulator with PAS, ATPase and Fis domain
VDSLTREGARRDEFQQWLDSFSAPGGSGQLHFPTEANWQQELAAAADRSRNRIYTWQETANEWNEDETITYAESKTAPVHTCVIDEVSTQTLAPGLLQAVQEKVDVLTELEQRAHPSWHSILEAYRYALMMLIEDQDPAQAQRRLAEAHGLREAEMAKHQKLVDYLNWFEVTRDFGGTTSRFHTYFATAKRLEQVEADPTHPNPIRASLLQVESRL